MMVDGDLIDNPLLELTAKQREVLDLVIQHKTSKEISRLLGISPHTVDQRIMLARGKLGVGTRGEVAQAYRRLLEIYEQPVYELSHVGFPPLPVENPERDDAMVDPFGDQIQPGVQAASQIEGRIEVSTSARHRPLGEDGIIYHRVLPEMFDGPYGTLIRLGFIVAITALLIIVVLGGLSMFAQLSSLLDR